MQNHHKIWEVGLPFRYFQHFWVHGSSSGRQEMDPLLSCQGTEPSANNVLWGARENRCALPCQMEGAGIQDVVSEGLCASLSQHMPGSKTWRKRQGDSSRVSSRGSDLSQILQTSSRQCESFFFFFWSFFCLHESVRKMSLYPISFGSGSLKWNDEPAAGAAASFWKDSEDGIVTEVLEERQEQMSSLGSKDVEILGGGCGYKLPNEWPV